MAEFQQTELLNELSRLLRGQTSPETDGGQLSPVVIHAQIIEIARSVFLLNPGAIFYLADIVNNTLNNLLLREISIVEDMLVVLENLDRPVSGSAIGRVSPSDLNNAATALLSLEAAGQVPGRPELQRFAKSIDRFTNTLRPNTTTGGTFRFPAGEARELLRLNFQDLQVLHETMVLILNNLRSIIDNYLALDIPTLVSRTALVNIRLSLLALRDLIESSSAADNDANSRLYLLRALAGKVVAALLDQFTFRAGVGPVLTSDGTGTRNRPDLDGQPPFLAQAAGEGTAAEAATDPGPWDLDSLDSGTLDFEIDGVALTTPIDLTVIQGPGLHGKNPAPFLASQLNPLPTWPGPPPFGVGSPLPDDPPPPPLEDYLPKQNLHLTVDPTAYEFTSSAWGVVLSNTPFIFRDVFNTIGAFTPQFIKGGDSSVVLNGATVLSQLPAAPRLGIGIVFGTLFNNDYYNTVQCQPPVKLGFKHLGTTVFFDLPKPESSVAPLFQPGSGFAGWAVDGQNNLEDKGEWQDLEDRRYTHIYDKPRVVMELEALKTFTLTHVSGNRYTAPAGSFELHWAGFYVKIGDTPAAERYEIFEVISDTEALIDTRSATPGVAAGTFTIYGSRGDRTQFTFAPDLLVDTDKTADTATGQGLLEDGDSGPRGPFNIGDTVIITVGPTVKTTLLPDTGDHSIASAVTALSSTANGVHATNKYAHASFHVIFKEQTGFNDKLTIQNRSRLLPEELAIAGQFIIARPDIRPSGFGGGFIQFPGGFALVFDEASAHEIFGFDAVQKVDPDLDPFLSVEELEALVSAAIDSETTVAEIVELDIVTGFIDLNPGTATMTDPDTDFALLGVGLGFLIELLDGDNTGIYFVTLAAVGDTITVQLLPGTNSRGFVGRESNVEYRLFTRRLVLGSANAGAGSSVEITVAPSQLGFPATKQLGTAPSIEAVNANGDNMDLSGLSEGDSDGSLVVESVSDDGTQATIAGGVSSDLTELRFSFDGIVEQTLATMLELLTTIATSRNLLRKNDFDLNLNKLDAALSPVLTPGATLQSNVNTVKRLLADLLAVLTASPRRTAEYSTPILPASLAIEQTILPYSAPSVAALDALLDSLQEHRFDRALDLIISGDLDAFFATTHETASFAGALLAATRDVKDDLPAFSTLTGRVEEEETALTSFTETIDSDEDFSDEETTLDSQ